MDHVTVTTIFSNILVVSDIMRPFHVLIKNALVFLIRSLNVYFIFLFFVLILFTFVFDTISLHVLIDNAFFFSR